jgi:AcrR family transcriptional regulator
MKKLETIRPIPDTPFARSLDTTAAALYWHVGSKDGLLDLMFDRVIGEQAVPDADPDLWREQLKEVARTMRATILRHRDIVRLSIGRLPLGPNALRWSDRVIAILRAGGLSDPLAAGSPTAPGRDAGYRDRPRQRTAGLLTRDQRSAVLPQQQTVGL